MITKGISRIASDTTAGSSSIVAEICEPVRESDAGKVRDLIEDIILEGCISTDFNESYDVNLYMSKLDALNRGNYKGLKLVEKKMNVFLL